MSEAKPFGHLYVAIFSNGTVKAGMSRSDPKGRVTSHANAGAAFQISMDSAFHAAIYTSDVRDREKLMHQAISELAVRTAGREWFKFKTADEAAAFSSRYLANVERMSFAERPIDARYFVGPVLVAETVFMKLLHPRFEEREESFQDLLSSMKPHIASMLAEKILALEEVLMLNSEDCDSGMPILDDAIHRYYDGGITHKELILSATNYPEFFMKALKIEWAPA